MVSALDLQCQRRSQKGTIVINLCEETSRDRFEKWWTNVCPIFARVFGRLLPGPIFLRLRASFNASGRSRAEVPDRVVDFSWKDVIVYILFQRFGSRDMAPKTLLEKCDSEQTCYKACGSEENRSAPLGTEFPGLHNFLCTLPQPFRGSCYPNHGEWLLSPSVVFHNTWSHGLETDFTEGT